MKDAGRKFARKKISMSDDEGERGAGIENESLLQICHCDEKMRRNGRAIAAQLLRRKNATEAFCLLYKIQASCYSRKWGSGAAKIPLQ